MIIGMDFGTTNSGLATFDGQIRLLPMDEANPSAPQVLRTTLYISRQNQHYVGRQAIDEHYRRNQGRPVRLRREYVGEIQLTFAEIGTFYRDVYVWIDELEPGRLFRSMKSNLHDTAYSGTSVWGRFYRLEDVVGTFLLLTKTRAEKILGHKVREIVLGRPVKFAVDPQADRVAEERLARAAMLAGYERAYFEMEPVAAALRYEQDVRAFQRIVVFDFGGGTLDITVMEVDGRGSRRILSTEGVRIAGDLFDGKIVAARLGKHFGAEVTYGAKRLKMPHQIIMDLSDWQTLPLLNQPEMLSFLTQVERATTRPKPVRALRSLIGNNYGLTMFDQVERAKIALSSMGQTTIEFSGQDIAVRERLSRPEFEQIIRPEATEIERCVDRALAAAGVETDEIDIVVRTGGSSLIPLFQRMLAAKFGGHKLRVIDEFSSVTAGLAVAGSLVERGELELPSYGPEILQEAPVADDAQALKSPVLTLSQELAEQDAFQAYQASDEHAALQAEIVARPLAVVALSRQGEIRRTPVGRFPQPRRGDAPPVTEVALAGGDELTHMLAAGVRDTLLLVTDRGRLFTLAAAELSLTNLDRRGRPLKYHVPLLPDERITAMGQVAEPAEGEPVILVTDLGLVFRMGYTAAAAAGGGTKLVELPAPHLPAVIIPAQGGASLFIVSNDGTAVRLPEAGIPPGGILALKPKPHERVVGALLVDDASTPFLVSSDGYLCRREMSAFPADRSRRKALMLGPEAQLAALVSEKDLDRLILGSTERRVMCVTTQGIPISERAVRGKRVVDNEWAGPIGMAAGIGAE